MVTDYLGQVQQKVSETTGKADGIESLARMVKDSVVSLDAELASLSQQRTQISALMLPYIGLYRTLTDSELYDKVPDLAQIDIVPLDPDSEDLTKRVFALAVGMAQRTTDREISIPILVQQVSRNEQVKLPWTNPSAVISSLLSRSDKWQRISPGVYQHLS